MTQRRRRPSDSPLVESITHVAYGADAQDVTVPDGCWDLVFMKRRGVLRVLQTGLITRPVLLGYEPGDEYLSVAFKPGVFMPRLPATLMRDRGVIRPQSTARAFWLEADQLEIPTFENAEGLVDRLVRRHIIALDDVVDGVLQGRPTAMSERTMQRHFLRAVGMTSKHLAQILRAQAAVHSLEQGTPAARLAAELGFADQAHMTRSLKQIMGRTPGQILRSGRLPDHSRP